MSWLRRYKKDRVRLDDLPSALIALRSYHANNVMTIEAYKHLQKLGIELLELSDEDEQKYQDFLDAVESA